VSGLIRIDDTGKIAIMREKRKENRVSATEQYPDCTGLNFEKVWAAMMENREQIKKSREDMDRMEKERKEAQDRMEKERKESQDKLDAMFAKTDALIAKTERIVARTSRDIGNLGNRMGDVIEHMVAAGAKKQFNALGFHFNTMVQNQWIFDPITGIALTEVDIVLENGEAIILVEIKTKPGLSDINRHKKQLQIYREHRIRSDDNRKIYGAIASPVFRPEIHAAALEAGFYTISQSGKAIVITVPEGFVPKAF
jgi:hypothetical protein